MRKGMAFALAAMFAIQPICVFGANAVFPANPVGMKLYRAHHATDLLVFAIIVGAFWLAWRLHGARRKATKLAPDDTGSYDI